MFITITGFEHYMGVDSYRIGQELIQKDISFTIGITKKTIIKSRLLKKEKSKTNL